MRVDTLVLIAAYTAALTSTVLSPVTTWLLARHPRIRTPRWSRSAGPTG